MKQYRIFLNAMKYFVAYDDIVMRQKYDIMYKYL